MKIIPHFFLYRTDVYQHNPQIQIKYNIKTSKIFLQKDSYSKAGLKNTKRIITTNHIIKVYYSLNQMTTLDNKIIFFLTRPSHIRMLYFQYSEFEPGITYSNKKIAKLVKKLFSKVKRFSSLTLESNRTLNTQEMSSEALKFLRNLKILHIKYNTVPEEFSKDLVKLLDLSYKHRTWPKLNCTIITINTVLKYSFSGDLNQNIISLIQFLSMIAYSKVPLKLELILSTWLSSNLTKEVLTNLTQIIKQLNSLKKFALETDITSLVNTQSFDIFEVMCKSNPSAIQELSIRLDDLTLPGVSTSLSNLENSISHLNRIQSLRVCVNSMTNSKLFLGVLKSLQCLTLLKQLELDFNKLQELDEDLLITIGDSINSLENIECLDLDFNRQLGTRAKSETSPGLIKLIESISKLQKLNKLRLGIAIYNNSTDKKLFSILRKSIQKLSSIRELSFHITYRSLDDKALKNMITALTNLNELESLEFKFGPVGIFSAKNVLKLLDKIGLLKRLSRLNLLIPYDTVDDALVEGLMKLMFNLKSLNYVKIGFFLKKETGIRTARTLKEFFESINTKMKATIDFR